MWLFQWQIDALRDQLGPFAADFGLDAWATALTATTAGVVLASNRWAWIQTQFENEVRRRGLPIASAQDRPHWTDRCPHTPPCGNATNCQTLSVIAAARKAREP